jgi:hypothetical protein
MAKLPRKLKLGYDNLEDAKVKIQQTFCLYKGKAFYAKAVGYDENDPDPIGNNKYVVVGTYMSGRSSTPKISLDDPDFNCSDYNIGYLNVMGSGFAAWLFRQPQKQYQQGLRNSQFGVKASQPQYTHIEVGASKNMAAMLENQYPTFKKAIEILKEEDMALVAFHKNFAMSRDKIHDDYLLEYKGTPIGFTPDLKGVKLMKEHQHLYEALKEAIGQ